MPMKNPPHPGGFVLRQCIEPFGLTITPAAAALGVARTTLSELVNEKRGFFTGDGRALVQGIRRQRRKLGNPATALGSSPRFVPTASNSSAWPARRILAEQVHLPRP